MLEKTEHKADEIQNLSQWLTELPDTPATLTKRKVVALLAGDIQRARDKGYTLKEIGLRLNERGFNIAYSTLRNALPRQKKRRDGKGMPRAPKADAARPSATVGLRVVAPVQERATREEPAVTSRGPDATSRGPAATPRAPGEPGRVVFPPGASSVPAGDGRFIPAPDSDVL
ncbi:MAG: hypothetical protein V9G18_00180 [Albidovulum sp.]